MIGSGMDTKKPFLDTNILVRIITGDNPDLRLKAYKLISGNKQFYIPDLVIYETAYVLSGDEYKFTRSQISSDLKRLLSESNLDYNKAVFDLVFEEYPKHPKLSFADCYLCAMAASKETKIMTFDKKLTSQCKCAKKV